jgi:hypothetical protein
MTQCGNCGCYPKGDVCHLCGKKLGAVGADKLSDDTPKGKPIRPFSKKREKLNDEYNKEAKIFLKMNPRCAVYPELQSKEVHHKKGRTGKLLIDKRYWLAVSRKAHRKITDNPAWAIEHGYSLLRLEKDGE